MNGAVTSTRRKSKTSSEFSSKRTAEAWPAKAKYSKWSSFIEISWPVTGEFSSAGTGPRFIPVVLPAVETEQWLGNSNSASLRANSLSESPSFHLSLPIAIITGDYRQISYPVITTLVSLLGYNSAILYPSYFPLLLSGPSISNPPTSNSFTNYLITPLDPTQNQFRRPKQSYLILIQTYPTAAEMDPTSYSFTNYLITSLDSSIPTGRGSQFRRPKQSYLI